MACTLNIKAENGNDSILFKDLVKATSSMNEAIDMYYYTKTDQFKNAYGDYSNKGYTGPKLDGNGEPVASSFLNPGFKETKSYTQVDLDNKASIYKNLVEAIPKIDNMLQNRINYLSSMKKKNRKSINMLQDILDTIRKDNINNSIPKFLNNANKHLTYLSEAAAKVLNKPDADITELSNIYKVSEGYSIIEELHTELLSDEDLTNLLDEEILPIRDTVGLMRGIRAKYIEHSKRSVAKLFNARDKTWSRRQIKEALDKAPGDIPFTEKMLMYIGDSSDEVLSMVGVLMMEAEHKIRRQQIKFNKELEEQLVELEKQGKGDTIFNKLIHEKSNGALHILDIDIKHSNGLFKLQDEEYAKVQNLNAAEKKFLRFFTDQYKQLQAMLPHGAQMGTRIPTIMKSEFQLLQGKSNKERASMVLDNVTKSITRSNQDMERGAITDSTGKPVKRIPTFYTKKYDSVEFDKIYNKILNEKLEKGMEEIAAIDAASKEAEIQATKNTSKYISKDLAHSLQAFHAMAWNFGAKNELVHVFEAAEAIVGSEFRQYAVKDSGGSPVKGQYQSGAGTNAAAQLSMFLNAHLYGQKEIDLGFTEVGGIKIDHNKVLRKINNTTGLVQLSANVLAGIANIGNGEYNNFMEAMGGEYYKLKDYSKASALYKKNIDGILMDIGSRNPTNIINLLDEHYNILQSYHKEMKASERTKWRRKMKTDSLFFVNESGEHFLQIRAGLAILENTKAFDKNGNELGSLLDQHTSVDGTLKVPEGVYIKEKDGSLEKFGEVQQNRIANKIGAVLRKAHGNYSDKTATNMQHDARLAMIMKFRGWMVEGLTKRYGKKQNYRMLEQDVEGFYVTGWNVSKQFVKDLRKLEFQLMKENWQKLTPHEKANVRRLVTEAAMVTAMAAAGALLSQAGKILEEDYNENDLSDRLVMGAYMTLVYEVNRLYTEVFSYANPIEALRLLQSPMASTSIIEGTIGIIGQMFSPFEEYESGFRKGDNKLLTKIGKMTPVYKQLSTLNVEGIKERSKWFNF